MPDALAGMGDFLTISPNAKKEITSIGDSKPKGSFRIKVVPNEKTTEFVFAWDDVYTEDDFEFPAGKYNIVMDALSIAYILDDYVLDFMANQFKLYKQVKE